MSEREELMSQIDHTRQELAETVSELVDKLDVKAQAKARAHAVGAHAAEQYGDLKKSSPPPVKSALDTFEKGAKPVASKVASNPKQAALIALAVVVLMFVLRRVKGS